MSSLLFSRQQVIDFLALIWFFSPPQSGSRDPEPLKIQPRILDE